MGGLGLFGLTAPEEYGGAGEDGDFTSLCVAIEELGRVDQSLGITLEAAVGLGINPIQTYGTEEQKQQWLPDLVAGNALAGFGLTEPESGSDAGATKTRAVLRRRRVGDPRREAVHHQLRFVASPRWSRSPRGPASGRTGGRRSRPCIVPAGTPGFVAEPAYDKLGWHASDTHPLAFDGCRVPEANLLGERGKGYAQFLATLDDGRVAIAALAVGCIKACLEMSVQYAGERQHHGRADRAQAGRRVPDRGPAGDGGRGRAAGLPGRGAEGRRCVRCPTSRRPPRWRSCTRPSPR